MSVERPLNVAVVGACPFPVPQGSQVFLGDCARMIRDAGHAAHLVVYGYASGPDPEDLHIHRAWNPPWASRLEAGPSWAKPLQDAVLARRLRDVVRRERIDIVDAHNYEALIVAVLAGTRPLVYHAHNAMADELPHFLGDRAGTALGRWLDRTWPRRADWVIAPHARLRDYLVECGCAPERISVIPPSVDVRLFESVSKRVDRPPVLYAGNCDAYQNLGLLDAVMERVRRGIPGAELRIATVAKRTPIPGTLIRTPDTASLDSVLREDSVFVCPRISWSGYPIKLLNAMAAAQAIVCCAGSAHPLTDEQDGLVVPDNDAEAFAEAVTRLLGDAGLRRRLGGNARRTAELNHLPAEIGRRTLDVYRRACTASRPRHPFKGYRV